MKVFLAGVLICGPVVTQQTQAALTDQRVMALIAAGVSQQEVLCIVNIAPDIDFVLRPDATDA